MIYSTGRDYRASRYGNTTPHHNKSHAEQLRERLSELQDALETADETMRMSLTQRIALLCARFPDLNKEAPCKPTC